MEGNIDNTISEKDCLVMDRASGELFRTEEEVLLRAQKSLNELVGKQSYFTYGEFLEILTEDWPEDKKHEFFEHVNSYEGWILNEKFRNEELDLEEAFDDEGTMVIKANFAFKTDKDEWPE